MKNWSILLVIPPMFAAIQCTDTGELFVHHWDTNKSVGKKYVLSNAFVETKKLRSNECVVPVYDHCKESFNSCDKFNRAMHDRKYPHKSGGNGVSGEGGQIHMFILSSLLQNVFNLWECANGCEVNEVIFEDKCVMLSDLLFQYAINEYK